MPAASPTLHLLVSSIRRITSLNALTSLSACSSRAITSNHKNRMADSPSTRPRSKMVASSPQKSPHNPRDSLAPSRPRIPSPTRGASPSHPIYYNESTGTFNPSTPLRKITPSYLAKALEEPVTLTTPQKLLVILDLNGTLFYRNKSNKKSVTSRPYLTQFLDFLFKHCHVMVWSSAQPHSVEAMLKFGFGNRENQLDRVWTREHFRLPILDYKRKVLTVKDLEFVWEGIVEEKEALLLDGGAGGRRRGSVQGDAKFLIDFDQTNTLLIDDSKDKIQLQPHNGLALKDFDSNLASAGTDNELLKVKKYLEKLVYQKNVSAYMRLHPFDTNAPLEGSAEKERDDSVDDLVSLMQKKTFSD